MSDSEQDFSNYKEDELNLLETLSKPGSTRSKKNGAKANRRLNRIRLEQKLRAKAKKDAEFARAREIAVKTRDIRNLPRAQLELLAKHFAAWLPTAKEAVEWLRKVTPGSIVDYDNDVATEFFVKHHPEDLVGWARSNPEKVFETPTLASIAAQLKETTPFVSIRWTDGGHDDDEGEGVVLKYRERLDGAGAVTLARLVRDQESLGLLGLVRLMRHTQRVVWIGDNVDMLGRHLVRRHYDGGCVVDLRLPMRETTVSLPVDGRFARLVNCDECWTCLDGSSLECEECDGHYKACRSFDAIGFMVANGFARAANPEEFVAMYGARYNADRVFRGLKPIDLKKHAEMNPDDSESESESGSENDDEDD